jgi:predicted transcriptional regulator
MNKTTLYLPPELQRAVRDFAHRARRSQADVIREAVATYLGSAQRPQFESVGAGADGKLPASRDEAWLEREWLKRR